MTLLMVPNTVKFIWDKGNGRGVKGPSQLSVVNVDTLGCRSIYDLPPSYPNLTGPRGRSLFTVMKWTECQDTFQGKSPKQN